MNRLTLPIVRDSSLVLIDTNIAIFLRDGDADTIARVAALAAQPAISIVTQVELEGGVVTKPLLAATRRLALDAILQEMTIYSFGPAELAAYRHIVEVAGHSRARLLDRMIAATALANDLTLISRNMDDFRDIPGLVVDDWQLPAA